MAQWCQMIQDKSNSILLYHILPCITCKSESLTTYLSELPVNGKDLKRKAAVKQSILLKNQRYNFCITCVKRCFSFFNFYRVKLIENKIKNV